MVCKDTSQWRENLNSNLISKIPNLQASILKSSQIAKNLEITNP